MSAKYKFRDPDQLHFVSFAVVDWIELFIRDEYRQIMLNSMKYCIEHKGLEIYAWCLMTSHLHLIAGSHEEKLENIFRDMKRHTSIQLRETISKHPSESRKEWMLELMLRAGKSNSNNESFQLWRQDNHPIELQQPEHIRNCLDYIHNNPVVAGFVENPEDYLYSSARNFYNKGGLMELNDLGGI